MLDHTATAWLRRLLTWLELFEAGFSRRSQRGALRRYVTGLLSDSRRKSMEAMWARLSDPGTYQAFQHFITHAPWEARRGLDATARGGARANGCPDSRRDQLSEAGQVGVARQYCGARGKIANCQTAVTVALWTGVRGWLLGATSYLPEEWLTPRQRARAQIPTTVAFAPKWRLALTLLRQVRAAGFTPSAVLGDAEFGDNATLRHTLHRAKLPYALGVSSDLKVFLGRPPLEMPPPLTARAGPAPVVAWRPTRTRWKPARGRPRKRRASGDSCRGATARIHRGARGSVRSGSPPRTTGARSDGSRPRCGCCANASSAPRKYYLVHLPPTASLSALVRLAHQRWAIEQQYQELKDEIGLDHFERRTLPGWQRHVVLTAIAYTFLQNERRRRRQTDLTLPRGRAIIQEVLTAHFFMTQPHYLKWMLKLKDVEMRN